MDTRFLFRVIVLLFGICSDLCWSANPNYSYHVNIVDPFQANFQQKAETRVGEKAEGFYSVVDPNGVLRTVTYVSDENGFRPTVTYSYTNPVVPINNISTSPVVPNAPTEKEVTTIPPSANIGGGFHTFSASPLQFAASYGTPVFTVKEIRHFYKTPPLIPLVAHQQPLVEVAKGTLPIAPLIQVEELNANTTRGYTYDVPEKKLEYPLPPPAPTVVQETTQPPNAGYAYPVPDKKLEYPDEKKTEPIPTDQPVVSSTPEQTVASEPVQSTEEPISTTEIEKDIEPSPPEVLVEPIAIQVVEPVNITHTIEPTPVPAPTPVVVEASPPVTKVYQYIQFGAKIPVEPKVISALTLPTVQELLPQSIPQPQFQQIVYQQQPTILKPQRQQVVYPWQPIKLQFTHTPAQVLHPQQQFVQPLQTVVHQLQKQPEEAVPQQAIIQAQLPVHPTSAPPIQKYEDIVIQNEGVMRYGEEPVVNYLPPVEKMTIKPIQPILPTLIGNRLRNPLTFNYGYDNGISKVSHSYYGSGW